MAAQVPIGRQAVLDELTPIVEKATAGTKRAAVIVGPPGIGKTTLLRWACDHAASLGCFVSYVRVPAAAGLPPRFPIGDVLEGLVASCTAAGAPVPASLTRILDTIRGMTTAETYPAGLPQLATALEDLAGRAPLAIAIDDFHWTPHEGAQLLIAAIRAIESPILLLLSARDPAAEDDHPVPEPASDLWIDRIEVAGFDTSSVHALATRILCGKVLPSLALSLRERTLGNPLFVIETLRHWVEEGALTNIGGFWVPNEEVQRRAPRSLDEMIRARLRRLPQGRSAVVATLAALGRDALFDELREITELDSETLVETMGALEDVGLVSCSANPIMHYRLSHPLYEAAAIEITGPTRRAALHTRIYVTLRNRHARGKASSAELAHHAVAGLEQPDDLAELLSNAAEEAESEGSYREAARWYGHLLAFSENPDERLRALERAGAATTHFAPHQAIELLNEAMRSTNAKHNWRLLCRRARAYRHLGLFTAAIDDLLLAFPEATSQEALEIRHSLAALHGIQGEVDVAAAELEALERDSQGTAVHAKAVGHLGQVAIVRGDLTNALERWREALTETRDPSYRLYLLGNLSWLLLICGEWVQAEQTIGTALDMAESHGDHWNMNNLLCSATLLHAWRGELEIAFDFATRAVQHAERLENPACRLSAHEVLTVCLIEARSFQEAIRQFENIRSLLRTELEPRELSFTYSVMAEAALAVGRFREAADLCRSAQAHLSSAPYLQVTVDRVRAEVLSAEGDFSTAQSILAHWIDRGRGTPFERARALEVLAHVLHRLRRRQDAVAIAMEALETYRQLGSAIRSEALEKWISLTRPGMRGRPRSNAPFGLTEREREILGLVILGRTDREIAEGLVLSVGTVRKHVEHVKDKTGAARRTQLVEIARRIGLI